MNVIRQMEPRLLWTRGVWLIHFLYLFLFLRFCWSMWKPWGRFQNMVPEKPVDLIGWLDFLPWKTLVDLSFAGGFLLCAACVLYPWSRVLRAGVVVCLLLMLGIFSSYGKHIHGFHAWLYVCAVLIFLPGRREPDRRDEARVFKLGKIIVMAQFVAVLPYFLAGLWKIRGAFHCVSETGLACIRDSFVNTLAWEYSYYGYRLDPFADWILNYPWPTAVAFMGLVSLQVLSVVFVFLPRTHQLFGVFMILFHVGSDVILRIPFYHHMAVVGLLFIASPFRDVHGIEEECGADASELRPSQ